MAAGDAAAQAATALEGGNPAVRRWLMVVAMLVFCMIVIGGATRLTGSGLSITEWQPILGAIPPLSEIGWQTAFAKYKQIPQYLQINKGMSLGDFQRIYMWEWSHRFLGRLIGIVFALPLVWFWVSGRLRKDLRLPLLGILALGGLQGFVGWYMVQSGLVDRIDVSQYRLALHLTLAFLILGGIVWSWLTIAPEWTQLPGAVPGAAAGLVAWLLLALVTLQVVAGALVAGLKAGLAYNTWPLMDGELVPNGIGVMTPWWLNLFENALTVQLDHRMLAYAILLLAAWHAVRLSRFDVGGDPARSARALLALLVLQALLGIWTLLAQVPLSLGLLHQGGAAMVYMIAVWHVHAMTRLSYLRQSA